MDWYEVYSFKSQIGHIEQFLTELAANETQLISFGYIVAFNLPTAEKGMVALESFDKNLTNLKRYMFRIDKSLWQEIEKLDINNKCIEQISLITLRLQMAKVKKPSSHALATINQIIAAIPILSNILKDRSIFGEASSVSVEK